MDRIAFNWRSCVLIILSVAILVIFRLKFSSAADGTDTEFSLWKVDKFKPSPAIAVPLYPTPTRESISLAGTWEVRTDPGEKGFAERWFSREDLEFVEKLEVPGNWITQGLGGEGTPSDKGVLGDLGLLSNELSMRSAKLKGSHLGLVWYRKHVSVPREWENRQIRMVFGAVLNSVRVWVNGRFVGGRWTDGNSFHFDVTPQIEPGNVNTLVMVIDNRWKSAATLSHLQWYVANGGPYHHMVLRALPKLYIESALVRPILVDSQDSGIAEVHIKVANRTPVEGEVTLEVQITSLQDESKEFRAATTISLGPDRSGEVVLPVEIDPVETWSWEDPNLYRLAVKINSLGESDSVSDRFGMRSVASVGNRFLLNGRPVLILGQHFNFFWPDTFTPPITKAEYTKHLKLMKEYGFNYLRTPWLMPEECYQAADELGMMLQLEFPYSFEPYDKIKLPLIKRLIEECLIAYGNHPSLVLLTMSNEGSWDKMGELNGEFCAFAKSIDPTRLVMDTDGALSEKVPDALLAEIVSTGNQHSSWYDYMSNVARQSEVYYLRPVIDHEFLNVPTLVDPRISRHYRNPVLGPPDWLGPKLHEQIRQQGMESEYAQYLKASHYHHANYIKEGMERSRKNPLKAGYSMCAWNDIEQGIHWGILDAFMNPKGISAEQMQVYNAQNVLLVDFVDPETGQIQLVPDYCRTFGEEFSLQPYVAYFGHVPVTGATLLWQVHGEGGEVLAEGRMDNVNLQLATATTLPRVRVGPISGSVPRKATLQFRLPLPGAGLENSWPVWLFPKVTQEAIGRKIFASAKVISVLRSVVRDVLLAEDAGSAEDTAALWVTDEPELALSWLRGRKSVLFLAKSDPSSNPDWAPRTTNPNPFDPGWFRSDKHMGTIIRENALIGEFPHNGYASWQFRNLINRARDVPEGMTPARSIVSSAFNDTMPHVQHQLLVAQTDTSGHLTYCMLKVLSGRTEADYLLFELLRNSRPEKSDPVVTLEALAAFLFSGS